MPICKYLLSICILLFFICPIGCDGIAGSGKRLDRCGVCGGTNSTCRLVSGIFTRPQLPVGYNLVSSIPAGACNLNITQINKSPNYLALRRGDGTFFLNGNWAIFNTGQYEGAGTRWTYSRQDTNSYEGISAVGPLKEPVELLLLYQQPNPGIKYEYMLPLGENPPNSNELPSYLSHQNPAFSRPSNNNFQFYHRQYPNNHQQANVIPQLPPQLKSGGYFDRSVKSARSSSSIEVPLSGHRRRHDGNNSNNNEEKKFTWRVQQTECSEPCGGGTQRPLLKCLRISTGQLVSEKRCPVDERPVIQTVRCNLKPCPAQWSVGPWSNCSQECNEGFQSRTVHCQQRVSPTLTMRVSEGACLDPQPDFQKSCFLRHCVRWETNAWSQCSRTCSNGIRSRNIKCVDGQGSLLDDSNCFEIEKPPEISPCNMGPCEGTDWFMSDWTPECTSDCGTGIQTRSVVCSAQNFENLMKKRRRKSPKSEDISNLIEDISLESDSDSADDSDGENRYLCDEERKPELVRECFTDRNCGNPSWFTSKWSECSANCGVVGLRSRVVLCVHPSSRGRFRVVDDSNCPFESKPEVREACEDSTTVCSPRWFTSEWGECSASCGTGYQVRRVSCRDTNWTKISTFCSDSERPVERRTCNETPCPGHGESHKEPAAPSSTINSVLNSPTPTTERALQEDPTPHQEPNEEPDDTECVDEYRNCPLVIQARLCKYKYYLSVCCSSCSAANKHQ